MTGSADPESAGPIRGYVPGAWDMFHIGHLNILRRAREACDYLIAGCVDDDTLTAMKGRPPVVPMPERMEILAALRVVDEVVADHSANKVEVWERVGGFDVLFKGDDWLGTPRGDALEAAMASVGVRVHYFPYTVQTSSTQLRRYIESS